MMSIILFLTPSMQLNDRFDVEALRFMILSCD